MEDPDFHAEQPEFSLVRVTEGSGKLLRIPQGYMTGGQVREFLNITTFEFRSLTHTGCITSTKRNARGWRLYDVEEIKALSKRKFPTTIDDPEGPTANRRRSDHLLPATISSGTAYTKKESILVFSLIREGKNLVDIVLQTELHAAVVQSIARDYYAFEGGLYITAPMLTAINTLALNGMPIKNVEDLLSVLKGAVAAQLCKKCSRPRAQHCASCLEGQVRRLQEQRQKAREKGEVLRAETLVVPAPPPRRGPGRPRKVPTLPMVDDGEGAINP